MFGLSKLTVAKFGGTSLGTAAAMANSAQRILENPDVALVVVSATAGTTNQLMDLQNTSVIAEIKERHLRLADEINAVPATFRRIEEIFAGPITFATGEDLSAALFCDLLSQNKQNKKTITFLDAREWLITDENGFPQLDEIARKTAMHLIPLLNSGHLVITQGFIGRSQQTGITTTLGRGGSDYSASLAAEACGASALEIWTDVPGVATIDPRIDSQAQYIDQLDYREASELAALGAKVLHPLTLIPAMRAQIPVFVGHSQQAPRQGTWIKGDDKNKNTKNTDGPRAIALRKNQCLLTISSLRPHNQHGVLSTIFRVLAEAKISVDHVVTSEISTSILLQNENLVSSTILQQLKALGEVTFEKNLTLLAIVGDFRQNFSAIEVELFSTIVGYQLKSIIVSPMKHSICLLVQNEDAEIIARKLHKKFF